MSKSRVRKSCPGCARRWAGGDWGEPVVRSPGKLISQSLQRQGFQPSHEFIVRFIERIRARGIRFNIRDFARAFRAACHYRQSGSRFKPRIAIVMGIPVLYRIDPEGEKRIALVGVLPGWASVCVVPSRSPWARAMRRGV